ncbi:DUF2723 domain-containing protein [Chloroflexi bacterium TSY]|nr:DUF2723 domain-containing protein [Chloroflexi bacterium TSY]
MKSAKFWTNSGTNKTEQRAGFVLILLCGLLYVLTLDNGLQPEELRGGDLITHQYAQVQARPSNAPGYPIYTMGGWLWFHGVRYGLRLFGFPLPNPIPILSGYSLLWALLSLWLFYRLLCQIVCREAQHWWFAWLLTFFYAVTYFFWFYATTTEQYSSAIAHTLALFYIYLRWTEKVKFFVTKPHSNDTSVSNISDRKPALSEVEGSKIVNVTLLLAFLCGLSLAHMLTVVFIVPPLIVLVLWDAPWQLYRPQIIFRIVIAALLPLLSYSYVYVRGAAHPEWWGTGEWSTPNEWFWAFLSTAQGRQELSWGLEAGRPIFGGGFPELIWQELGLPFVLLGIIGIGLLERRLAFLLYGTLSLYLLFCWIYRFGNWFQVILPAYPLILCGLGGIFLLITDLQKSFASRFTTSNFDRQIRDKAVLGQHTQARQISPPHLQSLRKTTIALLMVLALIWRVSASWPAANSHNRPGDTALDRAALLLDQTLPQNANLFASVDEALALQYLTQVWGIRPDLAIVSSPQASKRLSRGETVLVTVSAASLLVSELPAAIHFQTQPISPDWINIYSVNTTVSIAEPVPQMQLNETLLPGIHLVGFDTKPGPTGWPVFTPPDRLNVWGANRKIVPTMDLTLYWNLEEDAWLENMSLSVRPILEDEWIVLDEEEGISQKDVSRPWQNLNFSAEALQEELSKDPPFADPYRLTLKEPLPDGADGFALILYRSTEEGFENIIEFRTELSSKEH